MRPWILVVLLAWPAALSANPPKDAFGPWSTDPRHPAMDPAPKADQPAPAARRPVRRLHLPTGSPFGLAFGFWQAVLTRIDGPRCSHRPTCSAFGHQALARHGLPLGFWIALERLMRGARSSAIRMLPAASVPGQVFFIDRLEDYTFWLEDYSPWSGRKK